MLKQRALVRRDITVARLIEEVRREFSEDLDMNRRYLIMYHGEPLASDRPISDLNLSDADVLEVAYVQLNPNAVSSSNLPSTGELVEQAEEIREQTTSVRMPALRDVISNAVFPMLHFPAIIGRQRSDDPEHNRALVIDLTDLPDGRSVSRKHAVILRQGDDYHVELLKESRALYVNQRQARLGEAIPLHDGDTITLGSVQLTFQC